MPAGELGRESGRSRFGENVGCFTSTRSLHWHVRNEQQPNLRSEKATEYIKELCKWSFGVSITRHDHHGSTCMVVYLLVSAGRWVAILQEQN